MNKLIIIIIWVLFSSNYIHSQNKDINVYVILSEDCPICQYAAPILSGLEKRYNAKIDFHAVFPVSRSNIKSISKFKKKNDLSGYKTIYDQNQTLSHSLGASVTPEAIITDKEGQVLYRGRINDAYSSPGRRRLRRPTPDLEINLRKVLQNVKIEKPWTPAIGCFITYNKLAGQ